VRHLEMNSATAVTVIRIMLIPLVMVLIVGDWRWAAVTVYALAAATDSLDGWLARSRGMVTTTGAFLDPLADKLLVTGAMLALIQEGDLAAWIAMVILTREFAVTGLRLIAVGENLVISASALGKAKAFSQNIALGFVIAPHPWKWIDEPLLLLAVALTVISGVAYFVSAKRALTQARADGER